MTNARLDVLVHLPKVTPRGWSSACIAHALQYNILAMAETPEEAVEKVVNLTLDHCAIAEEVGIEPFNLAETYLLKAFFMGVPMPYRHKSVEARLSRTLKAELVIADARGLQEKAGLDLCVAVGTRA